MNFVALRLVGPRARACLHSENGRIEGRQFLMNDSRIARRQSTTANC
jgi:hypothetical protein